jgi:hypothetical protein
MRIKVLMIVGTVLAVAFLWTAISSYDGMAANLSPAQIDTIRSSRMVEPAHCRVYRHCHRRCNRRRCWSYCHRCG